MSQTSQLDSKLEAFIKAYHLKYVIRGLFVFGASFISVFAILAAFEFYIGFSIGIKKILLVAYSLLFVTLFTFYIAFPVLAILNIWGRKPLGFYASLIGSKYNSIGDKLLNFIQLKQNSSELALLALELKNLELAKIPFEKNVIRANDLKLPGAFLISTFLMAFLISLSNPSILNKGTLQLLDVNTYYQYSPFTFKVINELQVEKGSNLVLNISIDGDYEPSIAYVELNGFQYKLNRENEGFSLELRNIQENSSFQINADGYKSNVYSIQVINRPLVQDFYTEIAYPEFTNQIDTVVKNMFEYAVPVGSELKFNFSTLYSDSFSVLGGPINSSDLSYKVAGNDTLSFSFYNKKSGLHSDIQLLVVGLLDLGPTIKINEFKSEDKFNLVGFYNGVVSDDYGLKTVGLQIVNKGNVVKFDSVIVNTIGRNYNLNVGLDFKQFQLKGENSIRFYAIDNTGNKSYSSSFSLADFSKEAIDSAELELEKAASNNLNAVRKSNNEIQNAFNSLKQTVKSNKQEDWQIKNDLNSIQNQLEQLINSLTKSKQDLLKKNELTNNSNKEQLEAKKEEISKLLDQLLTDELKDLLKELESLQDSLNKDKLEDLLKNSEFPLDNIDKQLDDVLDYLKELQFEEDLNELVEDIKQSKQELEESNETDLTDLIEKAKELENLSKEADKADFTEINAGDRLEEIAEELNEDNTDSKGSNQDSKDSESQDSKSNKKTKNQQKKLEELANDLESFSQSQQQEQDAEDAEAIRQLLDNLVELSFRQEDVVNNLKTSSYKDPRLNEILKEQKNIESDFKMIEDSLNALAMRVSQAASSINKAVYNFNFNSNDGIKLVTDNKLFEGAAKFQYSLTELNNLAAMFEESLQNMQSSMQMKGNSSKDCKNPKSKGQGKGNKPSPSMSEMQKSLQRQLEDMKNGKNKGQKPGDGKPSMGGLSGEQFAKIAAEQALLKQLIQQLKESKNGQNKTSDKLLEDIDRLIDDNLKQLYNKNFNTELIKRTEEIIVKMLESEKALKEQEEEKQRESKENYREYINSNNTFDKYLINIKKELEQLEQFPVNYQLYYNKKVGEYFNQEL